MDSISNNQDGESQWLPISDLMSVLMMVFLLIAISYMLKVYQEKEKITEIVISKEVKLKLMTQFNKWRRVELMAIIFSLVGIRKSSW